MNTISSGTINCKTFSVTEEPHDALWLHEAMIDRPALVQGSCKFSELLRFQRHSSEVVAGISVLQHSFFPKLWGVSCIMDGVIWTFGPVSAFTRMPWALPPGTTFWWSGWDPLLLSPVAHCSSVVCGSRCNRPWAAEDFCLGRVWSEIQTVTLKVIGPWSQQKSLKATS